MDADTIMRRLHELEEENKRLRSLLAERVSMMVILLYPNIQS